MRARGVASVLLAVLLAVGFDLTGPTIAHAGPGAGPVASPVEDATATASGGFVSVPAARVLDTRTGTGAPRHPLAARHTLTLTVTGRAGIPTTGVAAVALTTTITRPAAAGYLTVFPDHTPRPHTSNLNFSAHHTTANLVIAPVAANGKIDLYNGSAGTTHLIADITGYYRAGTPAAAGTFAAVPAARVLDTRTGTGAARHPLAARHTLTLTVTGRAGIPTTGVAAVALTTTITRPAAAGYLTVFPDHTPRPHTSNLNFSAHQTTANLVIAPVAANGKIDLYNGSPGSTHLIADITGYYRATPAVPPPGPVVAARVTATSSSAISLSWTNPTDAAFTGVLIRRAVGTSAPAAPTLGTAVADTSGAVHAVTDTGLAAGTTYSYALFAHGSADNYAASDDVTASTVPASTHGAWIPTRAPLPGDTGDPWVDPSGVACGAAGSCLAVGSYVDDTGNDSGLIDTLTNGRWTATTAPLPAGTTNTRSAGLTATACGAAASCVAVGSYTDAAGTPHGLVEALENGRWTATTTPLPAGATATAVDLTAVACGTAASCVAVGSYTDGTGTPHGLIETLSGGSWTATVPAVPAGTTNGDVDFGTDTCGQGGSCVACPAAGSCVAVGAYQDDAGAQYGVIETLSGGRWTAIRTPLPADQAGPRAPSYVSVVTCPAPGSCVAVGGYTSEQDGQALYVDALAGGTWTASTAPLPAGGGMFPSFDAVSCGDVGFCAAVGSYLDAGGNKQGLIDTLSAGKWTTTRAPLLSDAAPSPDGFATISTVACVAPRYCVAFGNYFAEPNLLQGVLEVRSGG